MCTVKGLAVCESEEIDGPLGLKEPVRIFFLRDCRFASLTILQPSVEKSHSYVRRQVMARTRNLPTTVRNT